MKKTLLIAFLAVGLMVGLNLPGTQAANDEMKALPIGASVPEFTLPDTNGISQSLASLKGSKGTIILFTSARCPMVVAYHERLQQIAADYKAKGINVIGINSNVTEAADELKQHAVANKLAYSVLRDEGSKVADQFHAQVTPEIYLLNADGKLVYHGGVDDNRSPELVKATYLRDALDAMLQGKPIERTQTRAFGCTVKRAA
jgi:peroxiredoxin